jgi:hypothetical protein
MTQKQGQLKGKNKSAPPQLKDKKNKEVTKSHPRWVCLKTYKICQIVRPPPKKYITKIMQQQNITSWTCFLS